MDDMMRWMEECGGEVRTERTEGFRGVEQEKHRGPPRRTEINAGERRMEEEMTIVLKLWRPEHAGRMEKLTNERSSA